jgi:tripartite-type tricarboxylate transporter receptor subunit TctC
MSAERLLPWQRLRRASQLEEIMKLRVSGALCAVALLAGTMAAAHAQGYPKGPINLVIPYAPGDGTDIAARPMADELSKILKQPVLVINRPGAGGALGTEFVAKAAKDGYTLLYTTNATLTFRKVIDPATTPYDVYKDFVSLGMATRIPNVVAVRSDLPYKTLAELVEYAKKNPGSVRMGTAGAGTVGDFTIKNLTALTGAEITMVPFKGASPAVTDLIGGHIEGAALALGVLSSHMKSGALRGLAISSRFPDFPDVPALTEVGYKQNIFGLWLGFFAPAGVPAEVVSVLVPAVEKVAKDPATAAKLLTRGLVQEYATPEALLVEMREEHRLIEDIAKKAGLGNK